ncbi:MAG: acyl-CoA thioesterase [Roseinatronobacter sp.]
MRKTVTFEISFGDCDPAGIVFYPNIFRWMDASFHAMLRVAGGHSALCEKFGSVGLGLVDAAAQFKNTMRNDDTLTIRVEMAEWSRRTLTLAYTGEVDGTTVFTGREVRCLFKRTETGIVAGELAPLRDYLETLNV